jgi:hypothetical protein
MGFANPQIFQMIDAGTKPIKNKDTKKNGLVILLSDFSKRYKIWRTSEITKCNNSTNGI